MTEEKRAAILAENKAMADRALRVLAAAERRWPQQPDFDTPEQLEQELCFLGTDRHDGPGAARGGESHRGMPTGRASGR